jgi:molybdopterin synthase catalytic subunit
VTIRVLFFAYLRERCGRELRLTVADGTSVGGAWDTLRARFCGIDDAAVRFAVNRVYVDKAHPLHDNDELALIPPVSGGGPTRAEGA